MAFTLGVQGFGCGGLRFGLQGYLFDGFCDSGFDLSARPAGFTDDGWGVFRGSLIS